MGVGDLTHAVRGGVGAAEAFVRFGPVVQGEFGKFTGQQAGVQDGGEVLGGAAPQPGPAPVASPAPASTGQVQGPAPAEPHPF